MAGWSPTRGTPYSGLHVRGEAPPEKVALFQARSMLEGRENCNVSILKGHKNASLLV